MKRIKPLFLGLLLCGLLASDLAAQAGLDKVKAQADKISANSDLKHAQWAFVLMDATTGELLHDHNGAATLVPASTLKTVTSGAALGILGEDYTFKTNLEHDGTIVDGVLKGNVFIRGGGDPTLGSSRFSWGTDMKGVFAIWIEQLKRKGIRSIEGMIIGDAEAFEEAMLPATWNWGDIGNYYGAGACGLTFIENTYEVFFKSNGKVGGPAEFLRTEPQIPGMQFVNEMKTGAAGSGDNGYIYGAPFTDLRYLRGTIPQGGTEFSIKGSIPDPALFAAHCLKHALDSAGISVGGKAETVRRLRLDGKMPDSPRQVVYVHQSPALKDILYWLNKKSINLYAEHLLKTVGMVKYRDGSVEGGAKAVADYWAAKGVDVGGLHQHDGSGLSRYNGVTAMQLTKMLQVNAQQKYFDAFYNSLPIAGLSSDPGTMKSMCSNTAAANNVRAKSGFISRVRCYTGYVSTKSGRRLCFAMMANNYTCSNGAMRDMFDALMVSIAEMP
jgi:D-alanyl-D-alanine carboxypeptidase/D-alanyl-D-alanine-endopeptidase (penicillin-binding protein 4)